LAAKERLQKYRSAFPEKLSQVEAVLAQESAAVAAACAMEYLESALLGQRVLPFAGWDLLTNACMSSSEVPAGVAASEANVNKRMVLDATAISALEVLETLEGTYKGSLLHFMDHTSTPSGHRLLRQWLCAPLYNAGEIRRRQEVVEFFLERGDLAQQISSGLKKVNIDLERLTSRIWGYALQAERQAVMYEDITARRLNDFAGLLKAYEQSMQVITAAFPSTQQAAPLPERLAQITRTRNHGGTFPELQPMIERLRGRVTTFTDEKTKKTKYRPVDGADPTYDSITRQIENVKARLEGELQSFQRQFPKVQLSYVHRLPGYRYEVECEAGALPAAFVNTVEMSSQTKGVIRFQTDAIKQLVAELDHTEDRREDCVFPFLARIFSEFHANQAVFRAAIRCLAELDALLSLTAVSRSLVGRNCKPVIVEPSGPEAPGCLELREGRHPVAAAKMGNSFVPNDTFLNTEGVPGVLVVTGPNMGGKSTVLRQTCIAVVMAQLGCRVNAAVCRLSPVDRIFTRIGSYDTILEGKSTLLLELEETAAVIRHGSRRSLTVLDELGRGTSTFDGAAIASAVLDDLAHRLGCMVLFATHYHPVSREAVRSPQVAPFHMAAEVDERTNQMTFLYRFLPGLCPASHGHHVARLAGLPEAVVEEALARSAEFERSGRSLAAASGEGAGSAASSDGGAAALGISLTQLAGAKDAEGLRSLFRSLPRGE
jgi:DNA mismatch repair protein MSH6